MRQFLARFGIKYRRFPLWLMIFNVLCLLTAIAIALAGLWTVLGPTDNQSSQLLKQGAVNVSAAKGLLKHSPQTLLRQVKQAPASIQQQVIYDLLNLSDVKLDILLAKAGLTLSQDNASIANRRWQSLAKIDWSQLPQASAKWTAKQHSDYQRLLWQYSLIYGSDLAKIFSLGAIKSSNLDNIRNDNHFTQLLLNLIRTAESHSNLQYAAVQCANALYPNSENSKKLSHGDYFTLSLYFEKLLSKKADSKTSPQTHTVHPLNPSSQNYEITSFLSGRPLAGDLLKSDSTAAKAAALAFGYVAKEEFQSCYESLKANHKYRYWLFLCRFPRHLATQISKPNSPDKTELFLITLCLAIQQNEFQTAKAMLVKIRGTQRQEIDLLLRLNLPIQVLQRLN